MIAAATPPDGYVRRRARSAEVVARADAADAVGRALADAGTLYDYAAAHPGRRTMQGRAPVYAAPLPGGLGVVVRHSRHGGLLAPLTGDRFLAPSRAPAELATALRLARAGVPTPSVVAYARYPAGALLWRADVATEEIVGASDLGAVLADEERARASDDWLPAVVRLLERLRRVGARHPDLNVKNVLLAPGEHGATAYVLDVDRVSFTTPDDGRAAAANAARLLRSARKRSAQGLARVPGEALAALGAMARHVPTPPVGLPRVR